MPSPLDALNYAKRMIGNIPLDDANLKLRVLNAAHAKLWMAAPWRWTVGDLDTITLANDQQDYTFTAKADSLFLVHAKWADGQQKTDLAVAATLPSTSLIIGTPSQVSYIKGSPNDTLRVLPVPKGYSVPFPHIISIHKKELTPIDAGNEGDDYETELGVPTEWFHVYEEIVLQKAFQFSHDPRLGSCTVANGVTQYSGQMGVVEAAIADMRFAEKKFLDSLGAAVTNG